MAGPQGLCGLALVFCIILFTARTEADGGGSVPLAECCPGPDGLPPRPRMMLIGETGVGKSTLGNRLFGKKPGMCASTNSMLDPTHPLFGVGHGSDSHTNETAWMAGKWLGDYAGNSSCFTIVDTPGVGDVQGRDCEHRVVISEAVKNLNQIDVFVLIFKGTTSRFTKSLQDQLSFYEEMFGEDFWKRTIIEISYWRSSNYAKEERLEDREIDEGKLSHDLNMQLKKKFSLTQTIPVYFVDPMYTYAKRGKKNPEEAEAFKNETEKLWNFTQSGDPYTCKGHCTSPGFIEGTPSLKSAPDVNARLKGKVIMEFSIWLGGCDGKGDRNYDIYKDGVHIWTVIDEQGEKKTERKPKQMIDNENTPPHMKIFDECSQFTGSRIEHCNIELSKYKNVKVVLEDITEDCFGSYYLNNTNGRSEEVHIQKMADGFYSEWTEWSTWDEVKGAKERTRVCTEPVNRGDPCSAQGPPTEQCNSDQCAEPSTYSQWSDWKCQEVCYNPYKHNTHEIRTRTCTDASPVHSTQNCTAMSYRTDNSNKNCQGGSEVPPCPEMSAITTRVCSAYYDGTDDNVQLEFKNHYDSDPYEACMTDYLSISGPEFDAGATEIWLGKELLSCNGPRFRPIEGLDVRFHTNTWGLNLHHDELRLCSITVQFGEPGTPGYSKWQWDGDMYNAHYTGLFNSESNWVTMRKIVG